MESQHTAEQLQIKPLQDDAIVTEQALTNEGPMDSLFSSSLSADILALDIMTMTPLEAMNELYKLQKQAKGEAGKK